MIWFQDPNNFIFKTLFLQKNYRITLSRNKLNFTKNTIIWRILTCVTYFQSRLLKLTIGKSRRLGPGTRRVRWRTISHVHTQPYSKLNFTEQSRSRWQEDDVRHLITSRWQSSLDRAALSLQEPLDQPNTTAWHAWCFHHVRYGDRLPGLWSKRAKVEAKA